MLFRSGEEEERRGGREEEERRGGRDEEERRGGREEEREWVRIAQENILPEVAENPQTTNTLPLPLDQQSEHRTGSATVCVCTKVCKRE